MKNCYIDHDQKIIYMAKESEMSNDIEEQYISQGYKIVTSPLSWKEMNEISGRFEKKKEE